MKLYCNKRITEILISKGANILDVDNEGNTGLHLASENGNFETVKYLLNTKKCNLDIENKEQFTALHLSSINGNLNICKLLIENGANLNCLNSRKRTPLHLASSNGNSEIVRYLIQKGADTTIRDDKNQYERAEEGKTALDLASESLQYHKISKIFKESLKKKEYTKLVDK